jgi:hypothetical protein
VATAVITPTHELLGDMLIDAKQPAEALKA